MDHPDRIRKLRAKADSTTFPAEAASLRAKADELASLYGDPDLAAVRSSHASDRDLFEENLANMRSSVFRTSGFRNVVVGRVTTITTDSSGITITGNWFGAS